MNARVFLALALLALLGVQAWAQSDLDLNAGKTKLTISVKSDKEGGAGGDQECEDCGKDDESNSLVIKLPPEPKAARGYVPKNDLPSNDQQGSDVLGVVSAPVVTQPVIVAPVIGAQQPPGEACTDNCDAELAPPPVQIAGPTVASKVLHKEIFEDDSYVPVPETQTEARPAMVSVPEHLRDLPPADGGPTKRCEGDECNPQELPSVGDESHYHHLPENVHDAIKRQVQNDETEIARKREEARRRRQDEEDRREEEFQAERRRWRKEALEEEEEEERRRKQAAAADADRFKQKLPAEHRIPATPTEAEDTQADLQLGEADSCGTPPCQKVVVAVCEAPPCAPSPPCGCIGTTPCPCAPVLVAPPCACAGTVPCECSQPCAADDTECHVMSQAEREAKAKEAADARANEERIKHRTKLEEELRKHQDNIDQVGRMTRGLRYQYGVLRKQHERIKQQMLASKIALKNLGPDPYKGTEYDIEGPEPKAWDDLGVDDDDEDGGDTIPDRPLTNLDTVVKVVKRGVYGMAPEQAAKLLAAADVQAAQNASEIAATLATDSSIKQQEQIAAMIAATAVKNADKTLGVKSDGADVRSVIDKLNGVLAEDAAKAGVTAQSNPSDNSIKRIVSILAAMDPKKSSRDILRSIDSKNRELDEQEKNDELSFDWQQSLRKLNSMVQTIGKQHKYQSNKLDTSQINNRIKVCHFLNEWGVLDDYCKWLLYDAFKPHLAPPKPKPAAPAAPPPPPPPKAEEPKPAPAPETPPPPPQYDEEKPSYLPATYGASFGWAHGQAKNAFPLK